MDLFQFGEFKLHSGGTSRFKIECDALSEAEVAGLAGLLAEAIGPFSEVYGIPTGGTRLADAMRPLAITTPIPRLAIVDDVWTTGWSMREAFATIGAAFVERRAPLLATYKGGVLFSRGATPLGVAVLFRGPEKY